MKTIKSIISEHLSNVEIKYDKDTCPDTGYFVWFEICGEPFVEWLGDGFDYNSPKDFTKTHKIDTQFNTNTQWDIFDLLEPYLKELSTDDKELDSPRDIESELFELLDEKIQEILDKNPKLRTELENLE